MIIMRTYRLFCLCALILFAVRSAPAQPLTLRLSQTLELSLPQDQPKSKFVRLSVNQQGEVYVLDQGLNRILLFDATGALQREIGGFGWETEQFDRPMDIWAENSLDVFVTDYNNNRIQRFDRKLNFVGVYENDDGLDQRLQFGLPVAVTFSRFGELFVIDGENQRILRFNANGEPEQSFGDWDWGDGRLEEPVAICLNDRDDVLVADTGLRGIMRFDYYGNFLQPIRHDSLTSPVQVVSLRNLTIALDGARNRMFIFDADGRYRVDLAPVPTETARASAGPFSLAVSRNLLYVLDGHTRKVYCYQLQIP